MAEFVSLAWIAAGYERIGLDCTDASRRAVSRWAAGQEPGAHGTHRYELADFGIDADRVRTRCAPYLAAFATSE